MKSILTFFYTFLLIALCKNVQSQNVPNFNPAETMSSTELANYRQSIWDSLPAAVGWVNDFEGLFKINEGDTLESLIQHFEKETSIEIMLVTVDSNMVAKDSLTSFTNRLLKIWGIGKKFKKNGIVICICSGYHEIEISADIGIFIGDKEKAMMIKKFFIPYYKKNKYYDGTLNGLNAFIKRLSP